MYDERKIRRDAIRQFYYDQWDGLKIAKENGVTFSIFKQRVSMLLTYPSAISGDEWYDHWKEYCRWVAADKQDFLTPELFAEEFYREWNEEDHFCELIKPSMLDEL